MEDDTEVHPCLNTMVNKCDICLNKNEFKRMCVKDNEAYRIHFQNKVSHKCGHCDKMVEDGFMLWKHQISHHKEASIKVGGYRMKMAVYCHIVPDTPGYYGECHCLECGPKSLRALQHKFKQKEAELELLRKELLGMHRKKILIH
jgi:hypothetical protein